MKKLTLALICLIAVGCTPTAKAQDNILKITAPTSITILCSLAANAEDQHITLKANDFDVKNVLTTIFLQAKIKNYSIANNVQGNVTFELTDQTLENTLKIICRMLPITYSVTDDIYIVEMRKISQPTQNLSPIIPELPATEIITKKNTERINLMYIDPMDLEKIFGPFNYIQSFSRFRLNNNTNNNNNRPG